MTLHNGDNVARCNSKETLQAHRVDAEGLFQTMKNLLEFGLVVLINMIYL